MRTNLSKVEYAERLHKMKKDLSVLGSVILQEYKQRGDVFEEKRARKGDKTREH
jgi:hypothetical protein